MLVHFLGRKPASILPFISQTLTKEILRPFRVNGRTLLGQSVEKETELAKDVILYKHENPRFHSYLGIFSFLQFTFWSVMGLNMLSMKDVSVDSDPDTYWWNRINWGDNYTKKVMAAGSFLIGNAMLALSMFFTLRSVKYLILRKNREVVSIVTYTPYARNRFLEVPLNHICCQGSRTDKGFMPLKIKGRFFMFVVDLREGSSKFPNPRLFDQTVGMSRKLY